MTEPTHRSEQTGDASLDRIQGNVRTLVATVKEHIERVERAHGIGVRRIIMKDEAYRVTPIDFRAAVWIFDGTLTTERPILVPDATDATGYERWVENQTGQDIRFTNKAGNVLLTAGAGTMKLVVSNDGPVGYT